MGFFETFYVEICDFISQKLGVTQQDTPRHPIASLDLKFLVADHPFINPPYSCFQYAFFWCPAIAHTTYLYSRPAVTHSTHYHASLRRLRALNLKVMRRPSARAFNNEVFTALAKRYIVFSILCEGLGRSWQ